MFDQKSLTKIIINHLTLKSKSEYYGMVMYEHQKQHIFIGEVRNSEPKNFIKYQMELNFQLKDNQESHDNEHILISLWSYQPQKLTKQWKFKIYQLHNATNKKIMTKDQWIIELVISSVSTLNQILQKPGKESPLIEEQQNVDESKLEVVSNDRAVQKNKSAMTRTTEHEQQKQQKSNRKWLSVSPKMEQLSPQSSKKRITDIKQSFERRLLYKSPPNQIINHNHSNQCHKKVNLHHVSSENMLKNNSFNPGHVFSSASLFSLKNVREINDITSFKEKLHKNVGKEYVRRFNKITTNPLI